jgi:hypothetical protein
MNILSHRALVLILPYNAKLDKLDSKRPSARWRREQIIKGTEADDAK